MNNEEEKASIGKSISSLNELVESLTQNKLSDAIKIESLNQKLLENERSYEKKMTRLSETEIENVAFGRQIKRLSDENESLLEQLQQLDDKLNSKEKLETLRTEENRRLKDILEKNSSKIRSLIQENSDLKETLEPDTNQPKDQLKIKYEKCIAKLKLYREKIFTISDKLIQLKTEREVLLKTSKEYSQCISQWQTDIANASLKMIERINDSNKQFKVLNEENTELKSKIDALKSKVEDTTIIENMKQEIQTLKESLTKAEKHLTDEKDAYRKLKQAPKKTSVLDLEIEAYEKTLDDLNKKLENKKCQDKEFENTIKVQNETIDSLKSQVDLRNKLFSIIL